MGAPILTTERLTLRPKTNRGALSALHYFAEPDVRRHLGGSPPATLPAMVKHILRTKSDTAWFLYRREDGAHIGECEYYGFEEDPSGRVSAQLGYILAEERWGRGYMREALERTLFYLFGGDRVPVRTAAAAPGRTAAAPGRTAAAPGRTAAAPGRTAQAPERMAQAPERTAQAPERTAFADVVRLDTETDNRRSRALAVRMGFRLVRVGRGEDFGGRTADVCHYELAREEFWNRFGPPARELLLERDRALQEFLPREKGARRAGAESKKRKGVST